MGVIFINPYRFAAFSPLDLSPALWLDASDASTITASGSPAKVSEWRDKSGNNRHMAQATAAAQPSTGTQTKNGLNVLDFAANQQMYGSVWSPSTTAITIAGVIQNTTTGSQRVAFILGTNRHIGISTKTNYLGRVGGLLGGVQWLTTTTTGHQDWSSLIVRRSSGSNTVRQNAVNLTMVDGASDTPNSATGSMWVGGDSFTPIGNWRIAEIIVVDGISLSGNSLTDLESYLNAKWAVY